MTDDLLDVREAGFWSGDGIAQSSEADDWATPWATFRQLDAEFGFTLDACAQTWNAKCPRYFTPEQDGLAQDWGREVVFCNPPYGRGVTGKRLAKAWNSAQAGATVVLLIPARTDTGWWHDYAARGEIRFLRGRLKFERPDGSGDSAPFPSAVVVFKKDSPNE